jgi:hypothetical protein
MTHSNPIAGEAEFECGHENRRQVDRFSPYEDGLVAHEAGHVLFNYGEYGTALKCMEFASDRGIVWADDDVAVVEETMVRTNGAPPAESRLRMATGEMRLPMRRCRRRRGLVAALVAAGLMGAFFAWTRFPATSEIADPRQPAAAERFRFPILQPEPAEPAEWVSVPSDSAASAAPAAAPSSSAATGTKNAGDPLDGTAIVLRGPNAE